MEIQRVPFYAKLLPSIFADEANEQFIVASDWINSGSTELVYFNKSKFFYFIKKNELNLVQSCFLVYGLQWLENVSYFDMLVDKINYLCDVNHCSSGYEALCHWEKENAIKLKRLYCWNVINRKLKRVCRDQQRFEKSECKCSNKAILMAFSGITVVLGASVAIAIEKIADLVVPLYGVGIK